MSAVAPEMPPPRVSPARDISPMHDIKVADLSSSSHSSTPSPHIEAGGAPAQQIDEQELVNLTSPELGDDETYFDEENQGEEIAESSGGRGSMSLADALLGNREKLGFWERWLEKGFVSNVATFLIFLVGMFMRMGQEEGEENRVATFILSFGLFGFSGGITNWLAVKMLFDKVGIEPYYLYGSGVIPRQFIAIRVAFKSMIMKMFFDKAFLEQYLNERAKGFITELDLGARLRGAMAEPSFDTLLEEKLIELSTKPDGLLVQNMAPLFGGITGMVPMLKPFLGAFGEELLKVLADRFDMAEMIPIDRVISEVEALLNEKLRLITPEMVKELMEKVIREHLGWLVVWGNVFGGAIGVASAVGGYGS